MASKKTIEIVKATVPVLQEYGGEITKVFYKNLFENHPELKSIFNMTHQQKGTQQAVLANAIFQYANYIDRLEELTAMVGIITQKHTSLAITPEMYPIVGENLLGAIKEVLGDAATDEIIAAWAEAYSDLASLFIKTEEDIYQHNEKEKGGFRNKETFVIAKKVQESDVITSFYLQRKDGSPVPNFLAGQYVAVTISIPNKEHDFTRNYSLSDASGKDYLRISVKKEEGSIDGIVSNYLHKSMNKGDTLVLGMPSGDFVLKDNNNPVVLLAGGVGITPLLSMYKTLLTKDKKVAFVQCALNSKTHAFRNEIKKETSEFVKSVVVYNQPLELDFLGKDYDFKGFLDVSIISSLDLCKNTEFYFCGPKPFMLNANKVLNSIGVKETNIHYEFFGPIEELALV